MRLEVSSPAVNVGPEMILREGEVHFGHPLLVDSPAVGGDVRRPIEQDVYHVASVLQDGGNYVDRSGQP